MKKDKAFKALGKRAMRDTWYVVNANDGDGMPQLFCQACGEDITEGHHAKGCQVKELEGKVKRGKMSFAY